MSEQAMKDYEEMVERLSEIQSKISLGKDLHGYGFQYRNAEQILQSVKPLLKGAAIVCTDRIHIEKYNENGFPVGYILSTAYFHYKNERTEAVGYAFFDEHLKKDGKNSSMSKEQIVGCASSYARKYALQGLLAISDGADDPDGLPQNDTVAEKAAETAANNSEKVYQRALKALKECNTVSEMLNKKAVMTAKLPEYKADISRAYDKAVQDLDALNEQNQQAAQSHNDDCTF